MSTNNYEEHEKYISKDTDIFLIHGIGSNTLSFLPLKMYLKRYGFKNVHSIEYPVNNSEFEESLKYVNDKIVEILDNDNDNYIGSNDNDNYIGSNDNDNYIGSNDNDNYIGSNDNDNKEKEIVVIGQSFGGNISNNLHKMGRNVIKSICICSPLHGAKIVGMVESKIPKFVSNLLRNKPLEYLKDKDDDEKPPHDFHTISFGWFTSDFDGCVYKEETMLDPDKHTHITWCDHRTGFLDPRLFKEVFKVLTCKTFIKKLKKKTGKYSDL